MQKLSMKTMDIGIQTSGKPKSSVQPGGVSGDDFKTMIQNKSEDTQNSPNKQESKEVSGNEADKTDKTDAVDGKKPEGVSKDNDKAGKTENGENDTSQAEAMIAAQMRERLSYGFVLPDQEMAGENVAGVPEIPEVMDVLPEDGTDQLLKTVGVQEEAVVQPEMEVQTKQVPETGRIQMDQSRLLKETTDQPVQTENTAKVNKEGLPGVQKSASAEEQPQTQDFESNVKETVKTSKPEKTETVQNEDFAAEQAVASGAQPERTYAEQPKVEQPQTVAKVYVEQPQELPEKVTDTLLAKLVEGVKEFEIHIEPANLGKIAVKVLYEGNQATISIVCSEKRAMEALSQNAREIGNIIDRNLGGETTIIVEKQETDYLNQTRDENEQAGQNAKQQKEEKNQNKDGEDAEQFLQKLRLGLVG